MVGIGHRPRRRPRMSRPAPRVDIAPRISIVIAICALGAAIAYIVVTGIASRVRAASALTQQTLDQSVPTVNVVHGKRGAPAEEVVLPGNVQAFVATPIYARTNGYLKKWYFDIGARVKAGQLLAEIEAPE